MILADENIDHSLIADIRNTGFRYIPFMNVTGACRMKLLLNFQEIRRALFLPKIRTLENGYLLIIFRTLA